KQPLPEVPEPPATIGFAPITPAPFASLWDNLPQPKRVDRPQGNELLFGQGQGMVGDVRLNDEILQGWHVFSLPLDDAWLAQLRPLHATPVRPGVFFKATLHLQRTGDCHLDMAGWNRGYLWVN